MHTPDLSVRGKKIARKMGILERGGAHPHINTYIHRYQIHTPRDGCLVFNRS